MKNQKLEVYRRDLLARRDAIARELSAATAELLKEEESYRDEVDQAAATTDRAMAMQMKSRDRDALLMIDEALRRIDAGSFGECERCGESIPEGRLRAVPLTTLCIDCKAELESEEQRYPGRALA